MSFKWSDWVETLNDSHWFVKEYITLDSDVSKDINKMKTYLIGAYFTYHSHDLKHFQVFELNNFVETHEIVDLSLDLI